MSLHLKIIAAVTLLLTVVPAFAEEGWHHHFAPGPGPGAGAGLGYAALAGGYYAIRRLRAWRAKK